MNVSQEEAAADGTSESPASRRGSRSDELRDALEEMIVSGQLRPGDRIDESALTMKFKVSRTPMREAIKALVATGMLEVRPRQGVSVAEISIPMLLEMFETMAMFEGMCARYAARRATAEEVQRLLGIQQQLEDELMSGRPERFYELNREFHELLCDASHSYFVAEQTRMLRRRVSMYRRHVTFLPGRMASTIGEHARIIAAIQSQDQKAAAHAASEHVSLLGDDMVDFIARLPGTMKSVQ